ncbi:MAG: FUSC family protein [Rhodanobacter sp.]|jgi:hypothetical protein|nr:FUSC family protein [Rhodanobacter sp.]
MNPDSTPRSQHDQSGALKIKSLLREEWQHLIRISPSDRPWQMPLAAAFASGLPLLVGAFFDRMDFGQVSSLGGLVFLYLPRTPLYHRMVSLMVCAFAITACYAFGLMSHFFPPLMVPVLTLVAVLVTMLCRFYALGPPSSLFFLMAAAIGAYTPLRAVELLPQMVGLIALGALLACLIGFFYSMYILRLRVPLPVDPLPTPSFDYVVFDAVIIGACVGISLALAQMLGLQRPYWVPVSCLTVIHGASLRAVWTRQVHRVIGTAIGLLPAWAIFMLPLNPWTLSVAMMALTFIVETAIVRHYAFAAIFITPLTLLLAEAATIGQAPAGELIASRFFDTALGSFVGLIGGIALHNPAFRRVVGAQIRRWMPSRFGG